MNLDVSFLREKLDILIDLVIAYTPKFLGAIAIFIIGAWVVNKLMSVLKKTMSKAGVSEELTPYISSVLGIFLKVMILFSAAGIMGIETDSFVAVLAAAGFAIGLALQGSIATFASGVIILLFKTFKIGDIIIADQEEGVVKEIQLFNTVLQTYDRKLVIMPNGNLMGNKITNITAEPIRRVDISLSMPYADDFNDYKTVILQATTSHSMALQNPAPEVHIEGFDTHSVKISAWTYCKAEDYWTMYYDLHPIIKTNLGKAGLRMAYSEGIEIGTIGK